MGVHRMRCAAATDNMPSLRVIGRLGLPLRRHRSTGRVGRLPLARPRAFRAARHATSSRAASRQSQRPDAPPALLGAGPGAGGDGRRARGARPRHPARRALSSRTAERRRGRAPRRELLASTLAARLACARTPDEIGSAARRTGRGALGRGVRAGRGGRRVAASTRRRARRSASNYRDLAARAARERSTTALGRARFHARELPSRPAATLWLIALRGRAGGAVRARAPWSASVATLTLLLMGAAALVALGAGARRARRRGLRARAASAAMAEQAHDPAGQALPVRSVDQVGLLAGAFNVLVDRFARRRARLRAGSHRSSRLRSRPQRLPRGAVPRAQDAAERDPRLHRGAPERGRRATQRRFAREI